MLLLLVLLLLLLVVVVVVSREAGDDDVMDCSAVTMMGSAAGLLISLPTNGVPAIPSSSCSAGPVEASSLLLLLLLLVVEEGVGVVGAPALDIAACACAMTRSDEGGRVTCPTTIACSTCEPEPDTDPCTRCAGRGLAGICRVHSAGSMV